jgi:hypothetical protein
VDVYVDGTKVAARYVHAGASTTVGEVLAEVRSTGTITREIYKRLMFAEPKIDQDAENRTLDKVTTENAGDLGRITGNLFFFDVHASSFFDVSLYLTMLHSFIHTHTHAVKVCKGISRQVPASQPRARSTLVQEEVCMCVCLCVNKRIYCESLK